MSLEKHLFQNLTAKFRTYSLIVKGVVSTTKGCRKTTCLIFRKIQNQLLKKNRAKVRFLTIKPLFFNDFYELGGRGAAMWVNDF